MKHIYIVDTKLLAYYLFQRKSSVTNIFIKIASILQGRPKGAVFLCWDIGKSAYRLGVFSKYKGHRADALANKTELELQELEEFNKDYINLSEFAEHLNVYNMKVQGVEADDLASIITEQFKDSPDHTVNLITGDFDWYHMVVGANNVKLIEVNSLEEHDRAYVIDKYKLNSRREFSILKSIMGDKSDNIKFCKNIGPVKAKEIFDKVKLTYKDATDDEIIQVIEEYINKKEAKNIKKNLPPSITIHDYHVEDGRTTIRDAFLANMSIADPFTDTSLFTDIQKDLFKQCVDVKLPKVLTYEEFLEKSLDIVGKIVPLSELAEKIFGVKNEP